MAEEQVMPQNSQSLVLQNEHEKVLEKLRNMQLNNLTAKQQEKLKASETAFLFHFCQLCYSFFGLSENQLLEFSTDELKVLDKLISRKARPWAICQMIFAFGFPVVGWVFGAVVFTEDCFFSWPYLHNRKYLRKIYGENFLPETLKNKLQLKS